MSNTFNLKESYLSNLGDNNNTTINAVDKDLNEKSKTIPKESKQDFEDFKTQYKGVIDMKCSQDYGNSEDKDLWEDCAKELFLKSKNYILLGDEYEPKSLEKKTESKLVEDNGEDIITIPTGLSDKKSEEILKSVIGQMSDGIWENTPSMEKYWKFLTVDRDNNEIVLKVNNTNYRSGFKGKSAEEICKYIANKVKQIVKICIDDGGCSGKWDRNNDSIVGYMGYNETITVKDAYKVYDQLLGRKPRIENKQLTESNDINVGDEYINDYGAKITILEPTKDGEYQFKVTNTKTSKEGTEVFATRSMRNVLDMNGYKKIESKNSSDNYQIRKYPNEDEFKGTWGLYDLKQNKFIQKGSKYVMQAALKDMTNKQLNESYYVKLFNINDTDMDTIEVATEDEAIEIAEQKMDDGWRAVVYDNDTGEALYDYNPFKESLTEQNNKDLEYNYRLLDRLKSDCDYYLGNGNRNEKHLWAGSVDAQINKMKKIWNSLEEKPEWLTMKDINNYEKLMKDKKAIRRSKNLIKKYNKELNTNLDEVKENDLSKDLYQDEANKRITKMLMYLDIYLEAYDKALEENDSYNISLNETKINSKIEYLIPALNIKGGIKGLIKYLEENDFTFENRFKEFAHLLQNFDKEIKTENNDNEKEPINVFSKDSEEYKRLQKACDLLNEKTNENVEFFIKDVYFDYDQKWKWTTITTKDLITGTTWHTLNPAEQKNIINGKDLNNIVDNVLSGSLYKDFRLDAVNESLDDDWDSEAEDLEKKFKDAYEEYKKNNKYPLSYLDWNNLLSIRDKEKIIANNKKTESKVDNLALNQFRNIIDLADKGYKVDLVAADGTKVSFDEEDLKAMYVGLVGNDNDLIKLPSEENPEETRDFIQSQLDKSYNKKYESRPDKDAARTRMFNRSRKKLNMPNKFTSIDEIVSYLEKCEDQIDVVNVNTEVGSFNRQLHNDMLSFANKFIKENGYLEPYIDKDGNEQEGNFKKFKQEMIDFVKNYNLKTESKKDELLSRLEDPKFEYLAYFADNLDKIEKIIDNCDNKAKCRKYKEVLKSARAFNDGRNKKEGLDKNTIKKGIKDTLKRDNGIYTDDSIYDFIEAITGIKNIDDIPEDVYNKVAKVADELLNTNYKTESKLEEDQYENERRKGRPNINKIAEAEFYDNQDWYIQHIKDYKDEKDFIEKEKAEIASEYNLTEIRSELVCKQIYQLAKENNLI